MLKRIAVEVSNLAGAADPPRPGNLQDRMAGRMDARAHLLRALQEMDEAAGVVLSPPLDEEDGKTSVYRGVSWARREQKWKATSYVGDKQM